MRNVARSMRVQVLDGVERRRRWSADEKMRLVEYPATF
jgi:hypothetical protein